MARGKHAKKNKGPALGSMLKRVLTALVVCPVVALAMFLPHEEVFFVFIVVCLGITLHEFVLLSRRLGTPVYAGLLYSLSLLYLLLLHLHLKIASPVFQLVALCSERELVFPSLGYVTENLLLPAVLLAIFTRSVLGGLKGDPWRRALVTAFAFVYIIFMAGFILRLRFFPQGSRYVFYLFLITWVGDAGAYYVGSYLGRHKLTSISPRKTWEGVAGMVASSFAFACLAHVFLPLHGFGVWHLAGLALLLGAGGLCGDLFESLLKRTSGVKDSGATIPGHGGMLDKADALLFNGPLFYFYLVFFIL